MRSFAFLLVSFALLPTAIHASWSKKSLHFLYSIKVQSSTFVSNICQILTNVSCQTLDPRRSSAGSLLQNPWYHHISNHQGCWLDVGLVFVVTTLLVASYTLNFKWNGICCPIAVRLFERHILWKSFYCKVSSLIMNTRSRLSNCFAFEKKTIEVNYKPPKKCRYVQGLTPANKLTMHHLHSYTWSYCLSLKWSVVDVLCYNLRYCIFC